MNPRTPGTGGPHLNTRTIGAGGPRTSATRTAPDGGRA